jgi:protein-S-isoprenylcysteine O-methyltransferase Ste14
MVAGLLGLFYTHHLFSPSPLVIAPQAAAVGLMIWARVTFGRRSFHATADPTGGGLVTSGPYHFIRHPIYTSVCLFVWAGALGHLSLVSVALAALATAGGLARMLCEERLLVERYPEYLDYAARTARMIPFVF